MSPDLRRALEAWRFEAASKKPPRDVREYGLCAYVRAFDLRGVKYNYLKNELVRLFEEDGLIPTHPFDKSYEAYAFDDNKHLNPKRLAWVNKVLEANP